MTPRERLENLGARLEIAMAAALLREVNREMLVDAGQRVADIRNADKPLDEEGL